MQILPILLFLVSWNMSDMKNPGLEMELRQNIYQCLHEIQIFLQVDLFSSTFSQEEKMVSLNMWVGDKLRSGIKKC